MPSICGVHLQYTTVMRIRVRNESCPLHFYQLALAVDQLLTEYSGVLPIIIMGRLSTYVQHDGDLPVHSNGKRGFKLNV